VRAMVAFLPSIGTPELLIVLGIVILLFGARKAPELARSIGQALGELRHETKRETDVRGSEPE
jgi:sec-independent protein translocase protein TatA